MPDEFTYLVRFMHDPEKPADFVFKTSDWNALGIYEHDDTVFNDNNRYTVELDESSARSLVTTHWPFFETDLMTPLPGLLVGGPPGEPPELPEALLQAQKELRLRAIAQRHDFPLEQDNEAPYR